MAARRGFARRVATGARAREKELGEFRSNSMEQVYFCTLDLLVQCNSTHQTIEKLSHDFLRHFSTLYIEISLCETWRKYVLVCDRNHIRLLVIGNGNQYQVLVSIFVLIFFMKL